MKLLDIKRFAPIKMLRGDTFECTYTVAGEQIAKVQSTIEEDSVVNIFKIFKAKQFRGVKDAYICTVGEEIKKK